MDFKSEATQIKCLQEHIDFLLLQIRDVRSLISESEERTETKVGNLMKDMKVQETKHNAEITHLYEEFEKIATNIDSGAMKDKMLEEIKACAALPDKTSQRSIDHDDSATIDICHDNKLAMNPQPDGGNDSKISSDINPLSHSSISLYYSLSSAASSTRQAMTTFLRSSTGKINTTYTSASFHMHAAAIISESSNTRGYVWLITLISLMITMSQMIVLNAITVEASYPTCSSHQDCRIGEFCNFDTKNMWKETPRCNDCVMTSDNNNCSSVLEYHIPSDKADYEVDYTVVSWKINSNYTATELDCFAQLYCNETDILEERCDFIAMNISTWHITQQFTLIFMALLLAVLISRDVQDSIVEETYLNYGLKNDSIKPSIRMAAEILRLALRARQIVIPWCSASAAVAIIITDPLRSKNIALNLLTIDVILVADDLMANLFLPLFENTSTDKLLNSAARDGVEVSIFWSRVNGIIPAFMMVMTLYFMEPLMNGFDQTQNGGCSDLYRFLVFCYFFIFPSGIAVFHGVGHMILNSKSKTRCKAVMCGIVEMILDASPIFIFATFSWVLFSLLTFQYDRLTLPLGALGVAYFFSFVLFLTAKFYNPWTPIQVLTSNLFHD